MYSTYNLLNKLRYNQNAFMCVRTILQLCVDVQSQKPVILSFHEYMNKWVFFNKSIDAHSNTVETEYQYEKLTYMNNAIIQNKHTRTQTNKQKNVY